MKGAMEGLVVENVTKYYGQKIVLKDVTLSAKAGTFTVVLGPPGAGKTTLLRIIAGIEKQDKGRILIDGIDVSNTPPQKRNVALVFQSFALYPHMTVYENIASPLRARKMPETEVKRKVDQILEILGLSELRDRYPRELSGGQAQRVSIGRAMAKDARIYLFDEPFTNLDFKIRESMREELKRLCKLLKASIIFAASDPLDALSMADNVVILNKEVIEQGVTKEIYDNPLKLETMKIFNPGLLNSVEAIAVEKNGRIILSTSLSDLEIELEALRGKVEVGSKYFVVFKGHDLQLIGESRDYSARDNVIIFDCELYFTEITGPETICYLEANGHKLIAITPTSLRPRGYGKIKVLLPKEKIYIFDINGKRVL